MLPKNSVGKLNNLMTTDTARMQFFMRRLHGLWAYPVQIVIALAMLYTQLGWVCFVCLGVMIAALPMSSFVTKRMMKAFFSIFMFADKRLTSLNEPLGSMEVECSSTLFIKMHVWLPPPTHIPTPSTPRHVSRRRVLKVSSSPTGGQVLRVGAKRDCRDHQASQRRARQALGGV